MIKNILELLKDTNCKAEIVQLAKGKNKFLIALKKCLQDIKEKENGKNNNRFRS